MPPMANNGTKHDMPRSDDHSEAATSKIAARRRALVIMFGMFFMSARLQLLVRTNDESQHLRNCWFAFQRFIFKFAIIHS